VNTLVIPSPAKINLFLKVVGRRPDGYHEIITLLSRVGLFDTVVLTFDQPSISVDCSHPGVPKDRTNLAYQAASLFFDALSTRDGVAILIDKVIPVAAGLGGGSSNAAAALMGLNRYYGSPFSDRELTAIALKVGADVPFFLFRHVAVARGIGDDLEAYDNLPPFCVVLVCPKFEVSTAWVYRNLNLGLTNRDKNFKIRLFNKDFSSAKDFLFNDLEQVTIGKFPEIKTVKKTLLDVGAEAALMSGSGPSVFGLFKDTRQAKKAVHSIIRLGRRVRWKTFLVELLLP
jgi:4-diphosphocytidyl-2-C-methyl-D-erythritol kinase